MTKTTTRYNGTSDVLKIQESLTTTVESYVVGGGLRLITVAKHPGVGIVISDTDVDETLLVKGTKVTINPTEVSDNYTIDILPVPTKPASKTRSASPLRDTSKKPNKYM